MRRRTLRSLSLSLAMVCVGSGGGPAWGTPYLLTGGSVINPCTAGIPTIRRYPLAGARLVDLSAAQVQTLRAQGAELEPNQSVKLYGREHKAVNGKSPRATPARPWYLEAIKATAANALPNGRGEGVRICLVDTGVDVAIAELTGAITGGINLVPHGAPNQLSDEFGHGTFAATLMVGRGDGVGQGVAPAASLYVVKVFGADGGSTAADVAEGILHCLGKADIINLSLGTFEDSSVIKSAVDRAVSQGLTVIAAAGNEPEDVGFPARYPPVLGVGAINAQFKLATFSGRGPGLAYVAPGEEIEAIGAGGQRRKVNGTSFAAALTSGVEAVRRGRGGARLEARDLGLSVHEQGQGVVDASLSAL